MRDRARAWRESAKGLVRGDLSGFSRPARVAIKIGVIAPLAFVVLMAAFVTVSNQPRFCVTCHYMQPFYDAWKTSSHNHVACVACHIPPGAKNWLQHKAAASIQVVKYVTRQYGMRPWTEVDDASCLRSGCHETRLLSGKVEFGGVAFDHGPHLTSFRRVTKLRCTSCHAQIVQGTHISVTEGACFLCHFKNTESEPEMGDCRLCHREIKPHRREDISAEAWTETPETRTEPTLAYDHELILERSVDCRECHTDVVQGTGPVPQDRCLTCHSEPERIERYGDTEFMHRMHVTDHKVDCLRCHIEIEHALPPREETPQNECLSCHPGQHDATRSLYRGEGGHGAESVANPMHDVRVPCEGCHMAATEVDGRTTTHATAAGCMMCHGEKYGADLAEWEAEAAAWTTWAGDALSRTRQELATAGGTRSPLAATALQQATDNVRLVNTGSYVHNPQYAQRLLRAARTAANEALAAGGASYRWPAEPKAASPAPDCGTCHTDVVRRRGYAFGTVFAHSDHVGTAQLPCTTCHQAGSEPQADDHGRLSIGRQDCQRCHEGSRIDSPHEAGWQVIHGGQARHDASLCATCHSQASCDGCHGTRIPHADGWIHQHQSAGRSQQTCAKCHQTSFCAACHGAARPDDHRQQWNRRHGAAARQQPERCSFCHNQSTCTGCHGLTLPHSRGFAGDHGDAVRGQPVLCARCHNQQDCARCHAKTAPSNHQARDWPQTHGGTGQRNPVLCGLCHGARACDDCHGVAMPHPAEWTLRGHGPTAQREPELCARCHDQRYCQQCHQDAGQ